MNKYEELLKELEGRLKEAEAKYSSKKEAYGIEDRRFNTDKKDMLAKKSEIVSSVEAKKDKLHTIENFRKIIKDNFEAFRETCMPISLFSMMLGTFVIGSAFGSLTIGFLIGLLAVFFVQGADIIEYFGEIISTVWVKIFNNEEKLKEGIELDEANIRQLNRKINYCQEMIDSHSSELYKLEDLINRLKRYISLVQGSLDEVKYLRPKTEEKINEYYYDDQIVERVLSNQHINPLEVGMLRQRSFKHVRRED